MIFIPMEYIGLSNQQNTYPSPTSYKKTAADEITLFGVYPQNEKKFEIPSLNDLKIVEDTSFKFLLNISQNAQSESLGLYTSPAFYTELVTSINESNPYFINNAFVSEYIVNYYLDDTKNIFEKAKSEETEKNIKVSKNIFISADGSYDLNSLVKYIDWVVSPPKLSELESNGVIPASEISSYTLPEIKPPQAIDSAEAISVGTQNVQVYRFKFVRKRNLDREFLIVREALSPTARQLYRIRENETFIANVTYSGWYRITNEARTGFVGYIEPLPFNDRDRIVREAGPFYVQILVANENNNTNQTSTTTTSTGAGGGTGGSTGGGGGSGGVSRAQITGDANIITFDTQSVL